MSAAAKNIILDIAEVFVLELAEAAESRQFPWPTVFLAMSASKLRDTPTPCRDCGLTKRDVAIIPVQTYIYTYMCSVSTLLDGCFGSAKTKGSNPRPWTVKACQCII